MENYKEIVTSGQISKWTRCNHIEIRNEYQTVPSIYFREEQKTIFPDGTTLSSGGEILKETFENPLKTIPLLNPVDESIVGEFKYQDLYNILYSMHRYLAKQRDESNL